MAKNPALKTKEGAAGALILLVLANYAAVRLGWHPFLYCWGRELASEVYAELSGFVNVMLIAASVLFLTKAQYQKALTACLIMVLVEGMPTYAGIVFRMGGSCG